jgi:hypothetical protein
MISWFQRRFEERSSWTGLIVGACALLVLLGVFPLTKMVMLGAIAWALYSFWKSE